MATGSPEDVASPESEFGGSAARPGDGHRDRAAVQFDVQGLDAREHGRGRGHVAQRIFPSVQGHYSHDPVRLMDWRLSLAA